MNKTILKRVVSHNLPLSRYADDIMQEEDFREYVSVHGYHFSEKLSNHASWMLKNSDGSSHHWTVEQVRENLGIASDKFTCGDIAYIANMLYSDFYPTILKTEKDVLEATKAMVLDKDGYNGMIFMRWLSDLIGRSENVDWLKFQ